MIKKLSTIALTIGLFSPFSVLAQGEATDVQSLISFLGGLINKTLIPLFAALALMYTIYSITKFIAAGDDTSKKEDMKQQIFWGIIGLFVMLSVWSLVAVIGNTFGIFAGGVLD